MSLKHDINTEHVFLVVKRSPTHHLIWVPQQCYEVRRAEIIAPMQNRKTWDSIKISGTPDGTPMGSPGLEPKFSVTSQYFPHFCVPSPSYCLVLSVASGGWPTWILALTRVTCQILQYPISHHLVRSHWIQFRMPWESNTDLSIKSKAPLGTKLKVNWFSCLNCT